jgi:hypothetical protein
MLGFLREKRKNESRSFGSLRYAPVAQDDSIL